MSWSERHQQQPKRVTESLNGLRKQQRIRHRQHSLDHSYLSKDNKEGLIVDKERRFNDGGDTATGKYCSERNFNADFVLKHGKERKMSDDEIACIYGYVHKYCFTQQHSHCIGIYVIEVAKLMPSSSCRLPVLNGEQAIKFQSSPVVLKKEDIQEKLS